MYWTGLNPDYDSWKRKCMLTKVVLSDVKIAIDRGLPGLETELRNIGFPYAIQIPDTIDEPIEDIYKRKRWLLIRKNVYPQILPRYDDNIYLWVENLIAFTLPVFRLDILAFEIPTFSARSFNCIFLSASTLSKRIIIAMQIPPKALNRLLPANSCRTEKHLLE